MSLRDESVQVTILLFVTGEDYRFLALEQLREIGIEPGAAPLEPVVKNTVDGRNLYDPVDMTGFGFAYQGVGRSGARAAER